MIKQIFFLLFTSTMAPLMQASAAQQKAPVIMYHSSQQARPVWNDYITPYEVQQNFLRGRLASIAVLTQTVCWIPNHEEIQLPDVTKHTSVGFFKAILKGISAKLAIAKDEEITQMQAADKEKIAQADKQIADLIQKKNALEKHHNKLNSELSDLAPAQILPLSPPFEPQAKQGNTAASQGTFTFYAITDGGRHISPYSYQRALNRIIEDKGIIEILFRCKSLLFLQGHEGITFPKTPSSSRVQGIIDYINAIHDGIGAHEEDETKEIQAKLQKEFDQAAQDAASLAAKQAKLVARLQYASKEAASAEGAVQAQVAPIAANPNPQATNHKSSK